MLFFRLVFDLAFLPAFTHLQLLGCLNVLPEFQVVAAVFIHERDPDFRPGSLVLSLEQVPVWLCHGSHSSFEIRRYGLLRHYIEPEGVKKFSCELEKLWQKENFRDGTAPMHGVRFPTPNYNADT